MIIPILTLLVSLVFFWGAIKKDERIVYSIQGAIIYSLLTTGWYNVNHNPHLILWLCNFTAVIAFILSIRYSQTLFEVFFYFAWTGDLLTLFIWPNPVCPPLELYPLSWAGFFLKHTGPLALAVYFIKIKHRLRPNAAWTGLKWMLTYMGVMAVYNIIFNQNLLDLRFPSIEIMKYFGPWPYYVIVNILIGLTWYYVIHVITKRLKLIQIS